LEVVSAAADLYVAGGDYAKADQVTQGALNDNRDDPALWGARVKVLIRLGRREEARATLGRAAARFPEDAELRRLGDGLRGGDGPNAAPLPQSP